MCLPKKKNLTLERSVEVTDRNSDKRRFVFRMESAWTIIKKSLSPKFVQSTQLADSKSIIDALFLPLVCSGFRFILMNNRVGL